MKRNFRRLGALSLALVLCLFCLTGCSFDMRRLLGMSDEEDEGEELFIIAQPGGSDVPYPEGFDLTAKFAAQISGDTMCIAFNGLGIAGRDTGYFTPSGDTITLTAAATTDSQSLFTYQAALWQKTDQGAAYVSGCTVQFTCDGELYTADISGLDPASQYKLTISFDSGSYTITGGMSVSGLSTAEAVDDPADEEAA